MSETTPQPVADDTGATAALKSWLASFATAQSRPAQHLLRLLALGCATWIGHSLTKGQADYLDLYLPLAVTVLAYGADWLIHRVTYTPLRKQLQRVNAILFGDPNVKLNPGDEVLGAPGPDNKAVVLPAGEVAASVATSAPRVSPAVLRARQSARFIV